MTVTADSYESRVSEALVQMLADSSTFQTLTGATTATEAKAFIVEDDGGENFKAVDDTAIDIADPWAVVRITESRRVDRAWLTWGREGGASIGLYLRAETNDTPPEIVRRARNAAGSVAADMQALVSASASRLAYAIFNVGDIVVLEESGALTGSYLATITVEWRDCP